MVDSLIYVVLYAICFFLGVASLVSGSQATTTTVDEHGVVHTHSAGTGVGFLGFLFAMTIAMARGLLYEWLMIGLRGATLGKMAAGIKVVNQTSGQVPGLGSAFVRQLIPFAANLFCSLLTFLVYLSPVFDGSGRMQGWHDRAANDLVIKVR